MSRQAKQTIGAAFYVPVGQKKARVPKLRRYRDATAEASQSREPAKTEPTPSRVLSANGEDGPAALRSHRRFRLPAHRATSDVMAGAYPFLAEAGLGSAGVYIGQDAWSGGGFCFDTWVLYAQGVLTNPNCLLAGVVGKGKSCLAKSIATRSIAFGRRVYVPGDPKGEWTVVAEAVGAPRSAWVPALTTGSTRLTPVPVTPRSPTSSGVPR